MGNEQGGGRAGPAGEGRDGAGSAGGHDRLAAALRENLRRRKAQARQRAAGTATEPDRTDGPAASDEQRD